MEGSSVGNYGDGPVGVHPSSEAASMKGSSVRNCGRVQI